MTGAKRTGLTRAKLGLALSLATAWSGACSGSTFQGGAGGSSGAAGSVAAGAAGKGSGGGATGGSASGGSATAGSPSGGAGGGSCGDNVCGPGEFCCNRSCGICALEGAACPQIGCPQPITCGEAVCGPDESCCGTEDCGYCVGPTESCAPPICSDAGVDDKRCGRVLCSNDESCCNASCSTCVAAGGGCAGVVCPIDCSAMDASGEGGCSVVLGVVWTGAACNYISGCSCAGQDCVNLFASVEECAQVFDSCS